MMGRLASRGFLVAVLTAAATAIALALYSVDLLDSYELKTIDKRFSLRGPQSSGDEIVIVAIDPQSLSSLNTQPSRIPRYEYARLLDRLHAASPRMIGVDRQFFGRTDPTNDEALLAAIDRAGPVLLATHEGPDESLEVPAGKPDAPGAVLGSAAVEGDSDGVVRRMLYAPVSVETKTLAVRAAEMFRGEPVDESDFPANHSWIDFRGPPGSFPQYSFVDVTAGAVPDSAFTDKVVLVGVTDPVEDVFTTPASPNPMPGVEVQANALWTVLAGNPLRPVSPLVNIALVLLLAAIPAVVTFRKPSLFTLATSAVLLAVFLAAAQLAFNTGWIISVTYPIIGLGLATAAMIAVDAYMERRQRAALERTLGNLLPPKSPSAFFISYRRSQSAWQARDIQRELAQRFGNASVFMDTASIDAGETFPDRIASAIRGCSVMLVLIGPHWLEPVAGVRRIDNPDDWVRREIEAGLQRQEAVLVPVVLDGARAPSADDLPDSMKGLATRNAVPITGEDLSTEIDNLLKSIDRGRSRLARQGSESPTTVHRPA
jgi:CHASE2 domain-containing sensor protein